MSLGSAVRTGLQWRYEVLAGKLARKMDQVPWDLFWTESLKRREYAWDPPAVRVLEHDREADLLHVEIGDYRFWIAPELDPKYMPGLYKETFYPEHPHHFEFDGARVRPDDVVVDAGACEGLFTRFALLRGARVIIVEPFGKMVAGLRRTYEKEIAEGRVIIVQAVLTGSEGEATLRIDPEWPVGASVNHQSSEKLVEQRITQVTLDRLIADCPWGRCDFVKMDIEGSEREAVAGGMETLRRDRPRISIAVYHSVRGYVEIEEDIRKAIPEYRVRAKGLVFGIDGIWRPTMLHAWYPGA